ncbi:MAG: hypothetical protein IT488_10405 [Gammaproteobacteria bacterium]|nr:hypothetical protein [Gammaproteobacteria bacterium]
MTLKKVPSVFYNTIILVVTVALAACTSTGMHRSEKAGATMEVVESDITKAVAQVDATAAALEELIAPGQDDVMKAFNNYSSNVDKMESLGKRMFEHADKMSVQGKEYFEEWRTQGNTYTNPQIRALSEQRRVELNAIFFEISQASVGVKGAFKSYMTDISEIRSYLSNDLTPKGIEAIIPVAQQTVSDGQSLKDAVSPVLSAIGNAREEIAQGGTE